MDLAQAAAVRDSLRAFQAADDALRSAPADIDNATLVDLVSKYEAARVDHQRNLSQAFHAGVIETLEHPPKSGGHESPERAAAFESLDRAESYRRTVVDVVALDHESGTSDEDVTAAISAGGAFFLELARAIVYALRP